MKTILLLFFVLSTSLLTGTANAQIVDIPDQRFKDLLLQYGVDSNADGEIQSAEALTLTTLSLDSANISDLTGITSFTNLKQLDCSYNALTILDIQTLLKLERLNCQGNKLTDIYFPINANALAYLDGSFNQLVNINTETLTNLRELHLFNNKLSWFYIGTLPKLETLRCQNNSLPAIDVSASPALQTLICGNNQLYTLNVSANTAITALDVTGNPFTQPLNVAALTKLKNLFCAETSLTSLDLTKNTQLGILICYDNPFTYLDLSKNINMTYLNCGGPNLISIAMKNGANESLVLTNSPRLEAICADESQLPQILAQIVESGNVKTTATSYCYFVPGVDDFNTIAANARFDGDNNGCGETDLPANGVKFRISDGVQSEASLINPAANAAFYTGAGTFTVTPELENPAYFTITPPSATVNFPGVNKSTQTRYFCMKANGTHPDLEIIVTAYGTARPGFDAAYRIIYKNKGNQPASGTIRLAFDDLRSDVVSASPTVASQLENTLIWNYSNLKSFETRVISVLLNLNSPVETPALNGGDILEYTVTIDTPAGDATPEDNAFVFNQEVINSMDPNAKTCLEGDWVHPEHIGGYLHYNIEFENLGNGSAVNVLVTDVIDPTKFDINTLQILYVSHAYRTSTRGDTISFIFKDINLAAATGSPAVGGKGFILFKVKTKSNLAVGAKASNKADIFFDYNAPIATNTATTIFAIPTVGIDESAADQSVQLYPNPAKNQLTITSESVIKSIDVFDNQGRLLQTAYPAGRTAQLDITTRNKGLYIIRVTTPNGSKINKLVID